MDKQNIILKFDYGKKGFYKMVLLSLLTAIGILIAGIYFLIKEYSLEI